MDKEERKMCPLRVIVELFKTGEMWMGLSLITICLSLGRGCMRYWDEGDLGGGSPAEKETDSSVKECEELTYIATGNAARVTCASSVTVIGDYVIPSSLGGCPVVEIGAFAFNSCTGMVSVTIPNEVARFGYGAFQGCGGLTNFCVDASNSNCCAVGGMLISKDGCLIAVGGGVLGVKIPDGVVSIGDGAFGCCEKVSSVTIPGGVTSVGGAAFLNCRKLTRVEISDSVVAIGASAFLGCSELKEVLVSAKSKNRISMLLKKSGVDVCNLRFVER